MYEPEGIGGCAESSATYSARSGGCVSLISSGASAQESAFLDASETGGDVFFLTSWMLVPQDTDNALDLYDANIDGGFPASTRIPVVCEGDACHPGSSTPPALGPFGSSTFSGPGNLTPTPPVKPKPKPLTRAQRSAKALRVCEKKKMKHKRLSCEKAARRRFGPVKKKPAKKSNAKRSSVRGSARDAGLGRRARS